MSGSAMLPRFERIVKLPEPLLPTFNQVVTFTETHVKLLSSEAPVATPGKVAAGQFIWSNFRSAITARPGSDIAFDRLQSATIRAPEDSPQPMADLCDKVIAFIADSFPGVSREELTMRIQPLFPESIEDESRSVLSSVKSTPEEKGLDPLDKTDWEYRFIYGYPNAELADHLYALVTTIKYKDEAVTKSSGMFGLPLGGSTSVTHKYSVDIVAMRVNVLKGFGGKVNNA